MAQITIKANSFTAPAWAGDTLGPAQLIPAGARVVASQFMAPDGATVTLTANAAQNATSIAVSALANTIPSGTLLRFGAGKYAYTTAQAAAAATSIAVEALPAALTSGDAATYSGVLKRTIKSGTLIGRTYTERDAGTGFGPADVAGDDEIYLLAFDITDADTDPNCELLRHGALIKENLLPGWSGLGGSTKTKIRTLYETVRGAS